jgi:hypothetical protein
VKHQLVITSPNNSVAVAIYAMMAFFGFLMVIGLSTNRYIVNAWGEVAGGVWACVLLTSGAAALYACLTAPKRIDPTRSLIIEMWASAALCINMLTLELSLLPFWDNGAIRDRFPVTTLGLGLIFFVAFGTRVFQILHERRRIRDFRNGPAPAE